ncbi:sigma factor [Nocardia sp. NPDC050712]|uniref:sigma factor n=1 Tax=Nocardia sp. NPDC050712 TaxID=3155518 RepID=UPI0033EAE978
MSIQSTSSLSRPGRDRYTDVESLFAELTGLRRDDPRRIVLREELITCYLPLAEHIARKFTGHTAPAQAVLYTARSGLVQALDRYDPRRGAPFLRCAIPTITDVVRRSFRELHWAVRPPRRLDRVQQSIGPAVAVLYRRLGRMPTAAQIAGELGADPADVVLALVARNAYRTSPRAGTGSGKKEIRR